MTSTATRPRGARARAAIAAKTLRTDRWWFAPLITVIGLSAWVAYATVRVFMHKWYWVDEYHYLTPFYSPCVTDRCVEEASHFGRFLPGWWIIPDAALTLPFLLLFRLTCYYYRKAYYRSFWLSPPACAVPDGHKEYGGETRFPLLGPEPAPLLLLRRRDHLADQHLGRDPRLPLARRASASGWATSSCCSTW